MHNQFNSGPSTYSHLFVGTGVRVPTLNDGAHNYINFDNAASTPALKTVKSDVNKFLDYYSSVHRGTGYKSQISTYFYEEARKSVLRFLGADASTHICIFGKNTTEALNKLANRIKLDKSRNIILSTQMEHHSNDLPWRKVSRVIHVGLMPDGRIDEHDLDEKMAVYGQSIALVAITGASNVTGYINPIHRIARKAHKIGAMIAVDCAQLAPHRKVRMLPLSNPDHLDFVSISAHKMYAPFGTGALVGRRDIFDQGIPDVQGGGTVSIVTLDDVLWADPPDKDEAGSPNVIGAIALASALKSLSSIGFDKISSHEAMLTRHLLTELAGIDSISILGDPDPDNAAARVGVIPFNIIGLSHFLVASILGHEYGIGVRNGCFCAHPYILKLLNVPQGEADEFRNQILDGDRRYMPGLIRVSFGLYNSIEEIDQFIKAIKDIAAGEYQGTYVQDRATGEYIPRNWEPNFPKHFSLS